MSITNWKKLSLGIVTASAAFLLAACGDGQGETESPDSNEGNEAETEEVSGGSLKVSVESDYIDFISTLKTGG